MATFGGVREYLRYWLPSLSGNTAYQIQYYWNVGIRKYLQNRCLINLKTMYITWRGFVIFSDKFKFWLKLYIRHMADCRKDILMDKYLV